MKRGEKNVMWFMLAGGGAVLLLTVYLENSYQQRETRIDRVHSARPVAEPAQDGLDTRVIPAGLNPLALPAPDSRGASLLGLYCVQCHELPTPLMHSAGEWDKIVDRMQQLMESRSTGMLAHVIMPSAKDWQILRRYMLEFAQIPLDSHQYTDLDGPLGQTFQAICSQCHATPSPSQHTAREWPRVVLRMKMYMKNTDKTVPNVESTGKIVDYLQKHAASSG